MGDEEGDWITVASDKELIEAIEYLSEINPDKHSRFNVLDLGMSGSVLFPSSSSSYQLPPRTAMPYHIPAGSPYSASASSFPPSPLTIPPTAQTNYVPMGSPPRPPSPAQYLPEASPVSRPQQVQPPQPKPQQPEPQQPEVVSQPQPVEDVREEPQQVQPPQPKPEVVIKEEEPVSSSIASSVPEPSRGKYDAKFIRDNSIPDGTELSPGEVFTKEWIMRNTGDRVWPAGTTLVWQTGDKLEQVGESVVPVVHPPGTGNIHVTLKAPEKPGRHVVSHYRLCLPNGDLFGNRIWLDVRTRPE